MGIEKEIKFRCADILETEHRIAAAGGKALGPWYFERNLLLDTEDKRLAGQKCLLRLRSKEKSSKLTFKAPQNPHRQGSAFKVMQELETGISDPVALTRIFDCLGFHPCMRYEKFRKKWGLFSAVICLDILPFGSFMELEGQEDALLACIRGLNLDPGSGSDRTYYDLFRESKEYRGHPDFVFDMEHRANIARELGVNSQVS
ncbi:MAG: class IV adenylate cyclase [Desulfonatronovibrionaceae bacterium]